VSKLQFNKGDRVTYSVTWLNQSRFPERDAPMRATVVGFSADRRGAYIVKDGTKTRQLFAFVYLEHVSSSPEVAL
jgi:hypothetical protein